jgi:hypothetical protein
MRILRRFCRQDDFEIHFDPQPSPWHDGTAGGRHGFVADRLLSYPKALPMSEMVILLGMIVLAVSAG